MYIPYWKCLKCGKKFKPINGKNKFDFNCPFCGSTRTVSYRNNEELESDNK